MFINGCIFHTIPLAEGFKFGETEKGKTFLFPELPISRSCKDAEAIDDGPMRNLLATAGRIDYVAAYVPGWHSLDEETQDSMEGNVQPTK